MKNLIITFLFVFISLSMVAQEKDQKFFMAGYIKNLNELSFMDKFDQLEWTVLLHNRLNFKCVLNDEISLRLEIRNRLFYGDRVNSPGFSEAISYDNGLVDLSWNVVESDNILFNTMIDRFLINYTNENWDITLGRQRINWGINLVWNPNDIFNTYNFLDFDYEERPGSDALRVQYYIGDFSKIEVAAKKGNTSDAVIIAAMCKFNTQSYDVQLLTGIYQKDWVIGVGWAGNLKNTGFKGEVSCFVPYETYFESATVLSASGSVDYAFKNGLYLNGSLLYSSNAKDSILTGSILDYAYISAKHLMPYTYSGSLQLTKEFSPIIYATLHFIYSTTNHSVISMPSVTYSFTTNWEINFTGQSFYEFDEFTNLMNRFFLRIRWSF